MKIAITPAAPLSYLRRGLGCGTRRRVGAGRSARVAPAPASWIHPLGLTRQMALSRMRPGPSARTQSMEAQP